MAAEPAVERGCAGAVAGAVIPYPDPVAGDHADPARRVPPAVRHVAEEPGSLTPYTHGFPPASGRHGVIGGRRGLGVGRS